MDYSTGNWAYPYNDFLGNSRNCSPSGYEKIRHAGAGGIHLDSFQVENTPMDSGVRRNDGSESRIRVDDHKTARV